MKHCFSFSPLHFRSLITLEELKLTVFKLGLGKCFCLSPLSCLLAFWSAVCTQSKKFVTCMCSLDGYGVISFVQPQSE